MPFYEDFGSDFDFQFSVHSQKKHVNLAGMHIHPHYEIFITTNKIPQKAIINGNELPEVCKPSLNIFAPYSMHYIDFMEDIKVDRYIFYLGDTMMKEFHNAFSSFQQYEQNVFTRFILSDSLLARLQPFLDELVKKKDDVVFTKIMFLSIFHMIITEVEADQSISTSQSLKKINEIIKYIVNHCNENLTAEKVCTEFYISRSKLNKDLKKYCVNFHQLLREMRLSQAFYMLKNTNLDITDIATKLGFENDTYFYTFFKNATGMTPLQYRKIKSKK